MLLESKNCSSLAEKNVYSSTQWKSLSAEDKTKYNEKAASMDENSGRNLNQEITKLLSRLQELVVKLFISIICHTILILLYRPCASTFIVSH